MQLYPAAPSISLPALADWRVHFPHLGDLAYEAVTVAAILLVLGSLWIF